MGLNSLVVNQQAEIHSVVLHWPESLHLDEDQFFDFCQANSELRIERTAEGDCEIMTPTGGVTGWRNSRLVTQLTLWADLDGRGVVFDSSTGFILPNGAIRSPDVSWVNKSRLALLTDEQKTRFLPLCPDFVIELRSPSDGLKDLQAKMQEYLENGAQLGWLIDPENRAIEVYEAGKLAVSFENAESISGSDLLNGFSLDLAKLWETGF